MRFHPEGRKVMVVTFLVLAALAFIVSQYVAFTWLRYVFYLGFLIEFIWTVAFFRFPIREINKGENNILASADGEVVVIENTLEKEFYGEERIQISVFMSPFNVHVNWYPFDGKVVYTEYHPGKFLFAKNPKSSELNERNSIVVENKNGKSILIRQVAGMMAKRIVNTVEVGDITTQGQVFGIIRFGSRVDFFLPLDAKVNVKIGDEVKAQQTVIAEW